MGHVYSVKVNDSESLFVIQGELMFNHLRKLFSQVTKGAIVVQVIEVTQDKYDRLYQEQAGDKPEFTLRVLHSF